MKYLELIMTQISEMKRTATMIRINTCTDANHYCG